jgi:hypothetical protein
VCVCVCVCVCVRLCVYANLVGLSLVEKLQAFKDGRANGASMADTLKARMGEVGVFEKMGQEAAKFAEVHKMRRMEAKKKTPAKTGAKGKKGKTQKRGRPPGSKNKNSKKESEEEDPVDSVAGPRGAGRQGAAGRALGLQARAGEKEMKEKKGMKEKGRSRRSIKKAKSYAERDSESEPHSDAPYEQPASDSSCSGSSSNDSNNSNDDDVSDASELGNPSQTHVMLEPSLRELKKGDTVAWRATVEDDLTPSTILATIVEIAKRKGVSKARPKGYMQAIYLKAEKDEHMGGWWVRCVDPKSWQYMMTEKHINFETVAGLVRWEKSEVVAKSKGEHRLWMGDEAWRIINAKLDKCYE